MPFERARALRYANVRIEAKNKTIVEMDRL